MWKEMVPGVMVAVLSQWLLCSLNGCCALSMAAEADEGSRGEKRCVCKEVQGEEREMRMKTCS